MENLLQVVMERNRAVRLLETGKHGEPEPTWNYDWLGTAITANFAVEINCSKSIREYVFHPRHRDLEGIDE